MQWRGITAAVTAAVLCGWFGNRAFTEEAPPAADANPNADKQKMIEQLATPGEMHAWLSKATGSWKATGTCNCAAGTPTSAGGTAEFKMVMGGRWQEQTFQGSFENRPFTGYGLTGYDNGKKEFVCIWLDNHGTGATVSTGQLSDDKKTLTLNGTMEMGEMKIPYRQEITVESADKATMKIVGTVDGKESEFMQLTYERQANAPGAAAPASTTMGGNAQPGGTYAQPATQPGTYVQPTYVQPAGRRRSCSPPCR
jgi:hypothetical protein